MTIEELFASVPDPPASTQTAVWKDLNQLGRFPSTAPIPIAPGAPVPPVIFPGAGNGF
jgi:hypothetical protein